MRRVPVRVDEFEILVDLRSMDHQIVFLEQRYPWEAHERAFLRRITRPGDTVVDVGANLGLYSVTLAALVGKGGLVLAYEPQAELLYDNTASYPQVVVRPFALSAEAGFLGFKEVRRANTYSSLVSLDDRTRTKTVQTLTLDEEVGQLVKGSVDFIKVDVEGHEEAVFLGGSRTLSSRAGPIIMFEWNPEFRDRWRKGAMAVLKEIVGDAWVVHRMGSDGRLISLGGWQEPNVVATVIAYPPDRASRIPTDLFGGNPQ